MMVRVVTRMEKREHYQLTELVEAIRSAARIVLFMHVSPDGDTIGSALALKMILEQMKKPVTMVLDGVVPPNLFFLPDIYCIRSPKDVALQMDMREAGTLAIAVDVSVADRMGAGEALFMAAPCTAQVDHHETNPIYAMINVVDSEAPATAILVDRIQHELGLSTQLEESICLYTGLSTDTGNFVYQSTDAEAFSMMSRMMEAGLPLAKYGRLLFRRKEKEFVRLLGKALPTLQLLHNDEIAGMKISCTDIIAVGATSEHTDGVVDYAIDIAGVRMAYFARETADGGIKFSLRALSPYRVDEVAAQFGGGGHHLAAGCTVHLPLDEAVKSVQKSLIMSLEGGRGK